MNKTISQPYLRPRAMLATSCVVMLVSGGVWADPVQVWVQPSGDTFGTAYALQGEARTYFGRAECNACGTLEYKWDFSDGTSTAFSSVANPRYIEYAGKSFGTGTQWGRLTVREATNPANTATAQVDLQVVSADSQGRMKNSAIDRGLRYMYQNEGVSGNQSYWNGSGGSISSTGMALIAFENHGHNLQAPDNDIYKKSVQRGIQYLLESAQQISLNDQKCIGNPEANDGDSDNDGIGVQFGDDNQYTNAIAMLALVNSADKGFSISTTVTTSNFLNGQTMRDVAVDAKDYLAWAQVDGDGGSSNYVYCQGPNTPYYGSFTVNYSGADITDIQGYAYNNGNPMPGGSLGQFNIDWGDGSSEAYTNVDENLWVTYYNQPELSYYSIGPTHTYGADGDKTISFSFTGADGLTTSELCEVTLNVNTTGSGSACSASDAALGAGGWRYSSNYSDSDNSVTQWPVLALAEAENRWDIRVNPEVINMLNLWLDYSQCSNGAFGYTGGDSAGWCNYPKAAAGLIMQHFGGKDISDTKVQSVLNYLDANWSTSGYDNNFNNMYAMYALYKSMKVWGLNNLNGRAWESEYIDNLVSRQNGDGSWDDQGSWEDRLFSSYTAVAILAPEIATLPPVADAGGTNDIYGPVAPNQQVQLIGTNSYHQDPARNVVKWEWDFNSSDGLWWATKAAPAAGEGAVLQNPTVSYPDAGQDATYVVTLRVSDDTPGTPLVDADTAQVKVNSGNVAPVPVTNGPWTALPNMSVTFVGASSYDPNACTTVGNPSCLGDSIVSYEWDLDGDGNWNEANGDDGVPVVAGDYSKVSKSFLNPVSLPARLRVTDSHGLQAVSQDTLNIVSIALVYGQNYQYCFSERTSNRFVTRKGVQVVFQNQGNASAEDTVMTLTSTPANMQILKGIANLGDVQPGAGNQVTTACNATSKTADIELLVDTRVTPTGNWNWKADFEYNGNHYTVNGLPPLGP
jgi:hypothetical protein